MLQNNEISKKTKLTELLYKALHDKRGDKTGASFPISTKFDRCNVVPAFKLIVCFFFDFKGIKFFDSYFYLLILKEFTHKKGTKSAI